MVKTTVSTSRRGSTPYLPPPESLALYSGEWGLAQAAHLLRRTTFGPSKILLEQAVEEGLTATLERLFTELPLPEPPVYYDTDPEGDDPLIHPGETWVDTPLPEEDPPNDNRQRSIMAWSIGLLLEEEVSIRETLCLFWHNYFAINRTVNDPRFWYRYITTIRQSVWGDFRQLTKAITVDPCMLRYLNGNLNIVGAPNENYARELLELYTVGKGPTVGPGDYTTFTEQDVTEMARILTGWRDSGFQSNSEDNLVDAYFDADRHDTGEKVLSARFDNAVLTDNGENEYADLIDVIFTSPAVAVNICRRLYQWFVYYQIPEEVEVNIIEPLAQQLRDNDYHILPVLQTLLTSEHFFAFLQQGPMIKHPLAYVVGPIKQFGLIFPTEASARYALWRALYLLASGQDMAYFDIPDVAGWKAFYQAPLYYRHWINSITLQRRSGYIHRLVNGNYTVSLGDEDYTLAFTPLEFLATLDDALDVNNMLAEIVELLMPHPLTEGQFLALKELLIPGLPDFEWTLEYGNYLGDPDDEIIREALENRLRNFFTGFLNMAEFHLS